MGINQQKKKDLDDEFDLIQQQHSNVPDMDKYMVNADEDMPGFGEVELYDYNSDMEKAKKVGVELISDLVDLYLGDAPEVKEHPYIKARMREDAEYYSQMKTLQKLSEKLLLQQMKQIDGGDVAPRMYEITSKHMGEIRENIKDGRKAKLEIEDMYKRMRLDLGLNETVRNSDYEVKDVEDDGVIMDSSKLNETIDSYLKQKDQEEKNKNR